VAERIVKSYKVLVGMEIHVQLATKSKMFTSAANGFGGEPNSQVDPVVLGLPGVLPVMNKKAVEYSIKVGVALGCKIAKHTKWDRKSYYYPDLPKNYQISQYDLPLCYEGEFHLTLKDGSDRKVRIRRAHLEEDAGKLLHEAPGGYHIDWSIVDLNRAGTPLLEIVTEPDLSTGDEVAAFGQELQNNPAHGPSGPDDGKRIDHNKTPTVLIVPARRPVHGSKSLIPDGSSGEGFPQSVTH